MARARKTNNAVIDLEAVLKNGLKTHCPQGHEYTPENTKLYKGRRYCKTCLRNYQHRHYHDVVAPAKALEPKPERKPRAKQQSELPAFQALDEGLLARLIGGE